MNEPLLQENPMSDYAKEIEMALNRDLTSTFPNAKLAHKPIGLNGGPAIPPLKQLQNVLDFAGKTAAAMSDLEHVLTGDPAREAVNDTTEPVGFIPSMLDIARMTGVELQAIAAAIDRIKARL
jgi:hypothetical protein